MSKVPPPSIAESGRKEARHCRHKPGRWQLPPYDRLHHSRDMRDCQNFLHSISQTVTLKFYVIDFLQLNISGAKIAWPYSDCVSADTLD
jgi:hypothetical protein